MLGIMNAVIRTATRMPEQSETEYEKEKRIRWPGRVALEGSREELDRQIRLKGGLW